MWGLIIGSGRSRNRHHGFNAVDDTIIPDGRHSEPPLVEACLIIDNTGEYPFDFSEAWEGVRKGYYSYQGYFQKGSIVYHYFRFE